ncbi:hypothetical protein OKJ48_17845 [Streptomyces kunmingensis]|uniref:Integral membrane protein n=1 Tax=Streptomyces kunmingensis TaxID=68225 RepID=A0ABU6CBV5_9ACTN|nr:hypothetical protein [Streptomyces kunmingensis]MEB3962097.1 hypothetical protein [Streptomyces kunmingensis]
MTTKTDAQPDAAERKEHEEAVEATESTDTPGTAEQPAVTKSEATTAEEGVNDAATDDDALDDDALDDELVAKEAAAAHPSGVGQGAGAIVSVGLGIIALSGSWLGTVASARESLIGQLNTTQTASVATQVSEVYGDSWHAAALVGGVFSLIALIVGAVVLAKPAFGAPVKAQAVWIKSTAWAGVSLGVLGLLLAVAKYSDLLLGLPKTS